LAVIDAFLAGDPLWAARDLSTRQPAQEKPIWSRPTPIRLFASPVAHWIVGLRA
jgi:hypothetical protein